MFRTPVMRFSEVLRSPFVSIFLLVMAFGPLCAVPALAQDQTPARQR